MQTSALQYPLSERGASSICFPMPDTPARRLSGAGIDLGRFNCFALNEAVGAIARTRRAGLRPGETACQFSKSHDPCLWRAGLLTPNFVRPHVRALRIGAGVI
jgi:hypothetical protein